MTHLTDVGERVDDGHDRRVRAEVDVPEAQALLDGRASQ